MKQDTALTESKRIKVLNDNFRSTFVGGRVLITAGVAELPVDTKARLLLAIQSFANFNNENDPYGEHDFGSIELEGEKYFWKIDTCDRECRYGSEDPSDPSKTMRVLTIMRADEY